MNIKRKTFLLALLGCVCIIFAISLAAILYDPNVQNKNVSSYFENSKLNESSIQTAESEVSHYSETFLESVPSDINTENSDSNISEDTIYHGWVINNMGYTYFYDNSGYEQFNFKNTALERYSNCLNRLSSFLPKGMVLYNITVPVSSSFADIPRDVYVNDNFYNASQETFVTTVASKLNENIVNIPIVPVIEEHYDNDEPIFYRTDKNWTSLGAYYAYKEFINNTNFSAYELTSFPKVEIGKYLGSFYNAMSINNDSAEAKIYCDVMKNSPDDFFAYKTVPEIKTSLTIYDSGLVYQNYDLCLNDVDIHDAYNFFLGKTAERYCLETTADGGNLLIIGDSSVFPLVPFLASHYSKIDIIDPQRFGSTLSEFLNERSYDLCLTMCYTTNAVSGSYIPNLNNILGVTENE